MGARPLASMTSEVVENELEFYSKAEKYWKDVPATVDGMLGGYGHISSIDINSSRKFLQRFMRVGGGLSRSESPILLPARSWALPSDVLWGILCCVRAGRALHRRGFPVSQPHPAWLPHFSSLGTSQWGSAPHGCLSRMAPTG